MDEQDIRWQQRFNNYSKALRQKLLIMFKLNYQNRILTLRMKSQKMF